MREPRVDIEAMVRSLQSRVENPDYRYDSCDSADSGSDGEIEFGSSPRKVRPPYAHQLTFSCTWAYQRR